MITINGVSSFYAAQVVTDLLVQRDLTVIRNLTVSQSQTVIGAITVKPPTVGAIALRIRDQGDTVDRAYIDETGRGVFAGGLRTDTISELTAGAGVTILSDLKMGALVPAADNAHDIGGPTLRFRDLFLAKTAGSIIFSDGTRLAEDNANLFWDNTNKRLGIGTTTPAEKLHVAGNIRANAVVNTILDNLVNYAGTAKTVTATAATVYDSAGPAPNRLSIVPLVIRYTASNPAASGVTLTVICRAVYTDGTTTDLRTDSVAAGGSLDVTLLPDGLYPLLAAGKTLASIQLVAYASAAPAAGSEPTVTLARVAGVSF